MSRLKGDPCYSLSACYQTYPACILGDSLVQVGKQYHEYRRQLKAVAAAYGWGDLVLSHGFHETPQGMRFTLSEAARREVRARLLRLNHERNEEDVKAGLHEKKKAGGRRQKAGGKASWAAGKKKKGEGGEQLEML
jgi:hypothetical protein